MSEHTQDIRHQSAQEILGHIKAHEDNYIHLIRERLGIVIQAHQKNDLHKLILDACKKFNCSEKDYLHMLNEASNNSPVIEHLINGITIGETYFFRDANQMRLLQNTVLPTLIKNKREQENHVLRIWSAGSASGEEIYTIAMLLCDMLPDIKGWAIDLLATDINTLALKKAMTGSFSEWSMRSIAERYKQRYFTTMNQQYILAPNIRDMVNFMYLNLNEDTFPSILNSTNAQDLILCRNVLIYFDREHGTRLMQKLSSSLLEGGYLILGASDPIYSTNTDLIFNFKQGALFYRPTAEEKQKITKPLVHAQPKHAIKIPIKAKPILKTMTQQKKSTPAATDQDQKNIITQLLNEGHWQEILNTLQNYHSDLMKSAFFLNAKATALANLGNLEKAVECCQQSLALDSTNIDVHFTLAMVLVELNRIQEAEAELRRTLFLDHQFVMGHFQLGLLLMKNKQQGNGLKSLRNALAIVKANDPSQPVAGFQQLMYGHLAEILEHEIELYSTPKGIDHAR